MTVPALEFHHVTRRFGRAVALNNLDLTIEPGTVLGLAGRNAAGKTTALRLAAGWLHADQGEIRVCGLDPRRDAQAVNLRLALMDDESALPSALTIDELLWLGARLHPRWDKAAAESLLKRLDLDRRANVGSLSRGTRAKVALVLAVAPRPDVLLLDDPTSGLDPLVRREILEGLVQAVPENGGAVIWASHLIQDLERVADRLAVLDAGQLVLDETLDSLRTEVRRVDAVFDGDAPEISAWDGLIRQQRDGRQLRLVARGDQPALSALLRQHGARDVSFGPIALEDLLVECLKATVQEREVAHVQ